MPIKSKSISQPWLIQYMQNCGYTNISKGICFGFAHMAIQAMLIKELDIFINRLKLINRLFYNNPECIVTIEQYITIFAFFDGVCLYQNPETYKELFEKIGFISQNDCSTLVFNIIKPLSFQAHQTSIHNIYKISGYYVLHQLKMFFAVLEGVMSDYILNTNDEFNNQFSFIISNDEHAISLGYNHKNNSWALLDTTLLFLPFGLNLISKFYSKNLLIKLLYQAFTNRTPQISDYHKTITLFTEVFITTPSESTLLQIKNYFIKTLNNNSNWKYLHKITSNKFNKSQIGSTYWLYLATKYGGYKTVKQLIRCNANINITNKDNISTLLIATYTNHNKLIKLLIKNKANVNETDVSDVCPLLAAKQNGNRAAEKLLLEANANAIPDTTILWSNKQNYKFIEAFNKLIITNHISCSQRLSYKLM